jgi:hypothetical protein
LVINTRLCLVQLCPPQDLFLRTSFQFKHFLTSGNPPPAFFQQSIASSCRGHRHHRQQLLPCSSLTSASLPQSKNTLLSFSFSVC